MTLIQLSQMERAWADCTRAIELDAGMLLAYLNRGTICLQSGDGVAAARDSERALEIAPPDWPRAEALRRARR